MGNSSVVDLISCTDLIGKRSRWFLETRRSRDAFYILAHAIFYSVKECRAVQPIHCSLLWVMVHETNCF